MGRFGRRIKTLVAAIALLVLAGCAGNSLIISGEALDVMGRSFVTTANLYNRLHDGGKITDDEYRKFALFAKQFQVIYPVAVDTWEAVKTDASSEEGIDVTSLTDKILKLKQQLIEFYSLGVSKLEVQ